MPGPRTQSQPLVTEGVVEALGACHKGKVRLPNLEDSLEDLLPEAGYYEILAEAYQSLLAALARSGLEFV